VRAPAFEGRVIHEDFQPEGFAGVEKHLTDFGNARRFVRDHGNVVRYVASWRSFFVYDGRRFRRDDTGETYRLARGVIGTLYQEASSERDREQREKMAKFALSCESEGRLGALLELVKTEPEIAVAAREFDADPSLLNVDNGTIDLRTCELREHRAADLLTKVAPVAFDPSARRPMFESFLERIMGSNPALTAFLQRAVGYSLTGSTIEQVFLLLYGTGANGKTTFVELMRRAFGDYAQQADFETFLARKSPSNGPRNDIAKLLGARAVFAVEAEAGRRLAESTMKQLTGGDTVTCRRLHEEFFEFSPEFKLWLVCNHRPVVRDSSNSMWRRVRLVPFAVTIPPEEQDHSLLEKLSAELPGVLAWAVEGCLEWRRHGLGEPEEIAEATEAYREDQDVIGAFVKSCCAQDEGAKIKAKNLYDTYKIWAEDNGQVAMSQTAFGLRLVERGFSKKRDGRGYFWLGLRVVDV
jgi:putative DNA primase/helicase